MYFLKTASNNFSGSSRKSIPRKERVPLGVDSKDNIVRQKVWDPGSRIQDLGSLYLNLMLPRIGSDIVFVFHLVMKLKA